MPQAKHEIGEAFDVQFVWQLPDGDFIRAIFAVQVVDLDRFSDRYIVRLQKLIAGRQESEQGEMREKEALSKAYWGLVGALIGRKAALAYEVDDGRPVRLRLQTLTREHPFFTRFDTDA